MLSGEPMEKFDIKKASRALYSAPAGKFSVVDVPAFSYFMIDGAGDPNTAPEYKAAVEALYAASYTLKFMSKAALRRDYVVPPLQGLWWAEDMSDFVARRKDRWRWTMMIVVPNFIERSMAEEAIVKAKEKKGLPALPHLRFEQLEEGRAVQILHIGSYDDEGPILERLHQDFLPAHRLTPSGHHHEIYLNDPRKTPAEKLKTIFASRYGARPEHPGSVRQRRWREPLPERSRTRRRVLVWKVAPRPMKMGTIRSPWRYEGVSGATPRFATASILPQSFYDG